MDLETKVLYEFGKFRLDPAEHLLSRDGKALPLSPKAFELLVALVEKRGKLLSKDELMTRLWPDSFVEEANLTVNISALRKSLSSGPDDPEYIETIPKRGYRFVVPVTELRNGALAQPEIAEPATQINPGKTEPQPRRDAAPAEVQRFATARYAIALVTATVAVALIAYFVRHQTPTPPPASTQLRSLAILPFQNLKQDADNDFLAFSLADAVISKLDYVSALAVRPSYSIEKYRNREIEIKTVAGELNVDTLLTGTFIREGSDLRITAQLIDVKTERMLWRDAFDLKYDKLLSVQDHVAQEIIRGMSLHLSPTEAERLQPGKPIDPVAYEYYLRGVDLYARNDYLMAIRLLEKSAELDPNYSLTWAQLGRAYAANGSFQFGGREQYRKAQAAYEKALSLQPAQIEARVYMANLYTDTGRVEQAVPLLREALRTNPNHAEVHWELGYAYRFAGMLPESIAECEQARRLDPGVKLNSSAMNSYLYTGQYDKFLQTLPADRELAFNLFYRGFANLYQNNREQAAGDLDRAYELDPTLFQAEIGKALSDSIRNREASGLQILRQAQKKIEERGVGDPEAIYKMAEGYAVLGDSAAALRMLNNSVENGFFPYSYIVSDPLLQNLRARPEFLHIADLARRRHEAFKSLFF